MSGASRLMKMPVDDISKEVAMTLVEGDFALIKVKKRDSGKEIGFKD